MKLTLLKSKSNQLLKMLGVCAALCALPFAGAAQSLTTVSTGDAFLSAQDPTLNFGGAGSLAVSPTNTSVGGVDSIMRFNLASTVTQFNADYGVGNWTITGLTLSLASNIGTSGATQNNPLIPSPVSGGNFAIDWLSYDGWLEGTGNGMGSGNTVSGAVTYNSIPTLLSSAYGLLGNFAYSPPGNNIRATYSLPLNSGLVSNILTGENGGDVSLFLTATSGSSIGYLFNSKEYSSGANIPEFTVTVSVVPEPATLALLGMSLGGLMFSRKLAGKK